MKRTSFFKVFLALVALLSHAHLLAAGDRAPASAPTSHSTDGAIPRSQKPAPEVAEKIQEVFTGNRSPPRSTIELDLERFEKADGTIRYRVRAFDEKGPYAGKVFLGQEFNTLADIPQPEHSITGNHKERLPSSNP